MATTACTIVGDFADQSTAEQAASDLQRAGFDRNQIQVTSGHDYATDTARGNTAVPKALKSVAA